MRILVGYILLTVALAAIGAALWTSGQLDRRLTEAQKQLLNLESSVTADQFSAFQESIGYARRLPWMAKVEADARRERAISEFWSKDYGPLDVPRDANGAVAEPDPAILLVEANALYRAAKPNTDDPQSVRRLESVLDMYAEVLKRAPDDATAAYNYEWVARVRDNLARPARSSKQGAKEPTATAKARPPQTIHGDQGAPPEGTDMSIFQTLVPKQGDERRETEEAGKAGKRVRKG